MTRRFYSREDVETHYGSDRPAVNVKVYESLEDGFTARFGGYEPEADADFTLEWIRGNVDDGLVDRRRSIRAGKPHPSA